MHTSTLSIQHPATILITFATLVIFSTLVKEIPLQIINTIFALIYLISLDRSRSSAKLVMFVIVTSFAIALINPLLNTNGQEIIFTYMGGRKYTYESLLLGIHTALMFASVVIWFAGFNRTVDDNGIFYIFGRFIPSITLVLILSLRLVPTYRKKAQSINEARKSLGINTGEGSTLDKLKGAGAILSSLATQALIGSVETSASMQSRGYGVHKRTSLNSYKFRAQDFLQILLVILCSGTLIACLVNEPPVTQATNSLYSIYNQVEALATSILCAIPTFTYFQEWFLWRCSLSKI